MDLKQGKMSMTEYHQKFSHATVLRSLITLMRCSTSQERDTKKLCSLAQSASGLSPAKIPDSVLRAVPATLVPIIIFSATPITTVSASTKTQDATLADNRDSEPTSVQRQHKHDHMIISLSSEPILWTRNFSVAHLQWCHPLPRCHYSESIT